MRIREEIVEGYNRKHPDVILYIKREASTDVTRKLILVDKLFGWIDLEIKVEISWKFTQMTRNINIVIKEKP